MTSPHKHLWPVVADPPVDDLVIGHIAHVRTRRGYRHWKIRLVKRSEWGGRHFIVGMDSRGLCHVAWADRVSRVGPVRKALNR